MVTNLLQVGGWSSRIRQGHARTLGGCYAIWECGNVVIRRCRIVLRPKIDQIASHGPRVAGNHVTTLWCSRALAAGPRISVNATFLGPTLSTTIPLSMSVLKSDSCTTFVLRNATTYRCVLTRVWQWLTRLSNNSQKMYPKYPSQLVRKVSLGEEGTPAESRPLCLPRFQCG